MTKTKLIKFCYGIVKPDGTPYMSESCICEDKDVLRDELENANAGEHEGRCRIVRLYRRGADKEPRRP